MLFRSALKHLDENYLYFAVVADGKLSIYPAKKRLKFPAMALDEKIRIGTSAFVANGWRGSFYPPGTKSTDFLSYYSTHFNTVEVDSTFREIPATTTVEKWYQRTPPGFIFAAKLPQTITHINVLVNCEDEGCGHTNGPS